MISSLMLVAFLGVSSHEMPTLVVVTLPVRIVERVIEVKPLRSVVIRVRNVRPLRRLAIRSLQPLQRKPVRRVLRVYKFIPIK